MDTGDFMFDLPKHRSSAIKVIGVGGGGSNAVNYMYQQGIEGVDFAICNTDAQALNNSPVPNRIQLGKTVTEGMGAGANPEIGEQAALESMDDIKGILDEHTKMVFVTAGMGGGTGTGAAPIIAGIAKELGILTVGIVTAPFFFEGKMRLDQAQEGIQKMQKNVDSLIVINNDKLRELYGNLGYKASFAKADEVLTTAAKGIAEVISKQYAMNIDLRDARTVLADSGTAIMGAGEASGENKAMDAITSALDSPLLNNNKISGAKNVLLLILSGEMEITMDEIAKINEYIQTEAKNNANIIMGVGEDLSLGDKISVTVIATGFPTDEQVYTGREDEKVFHTLVEEQSITKTLSPDTPFPVHVRKMPEQSRIVEEESIQEEEKEVKFFLEEEIEEKPQIKTEIVEPESGFVLETREAKPEISESKEEDSKDEFSQSILFSLDDDLEDEAIEVDASYTYVSQDTQKAEVKPEVQTFNEEQDPLDVPISHSLSQAIEERRARLKQFNYKFKNTLSNKVVDDLESVPAYKRQGLELEGRDSHQPSDYVLSKDNKGDHKMRPNNFLHDNVD